MLNCEHKKGPSTLVVFGNLILSHQDLVKWSTKPKRLFMAGIAPYPSIVARPQEPPRQSAKQRNVETQVEKIADCITSHLRGLANRSKSWSAGSRGATGDGERHANLGGVQRKTLPHVDKVRDTRDQKDHPH